MKPSVLYSSPLPRTLSTAQEISRKLSLPVAPLEGIKEVNLGELEGITGEEMRSRYPQIYSAWTEDPSDVGGGGGGRGGGESMRQLQERAWQAVEGIERAHPEEVIVAVSHNFAIRTVMCHFLGLPLSQFHVLRVDLGSISILRSRPGFRQVVSINDRCHLSHDSLPES